MHVGQPSLWTVTNSSGFQVTGGEVAQVGAGLLRCYLIWRDPDSGSQSGYIVKYMIAGAGVSAGLLPANLRWSDTGTPGTFGSTVYLNTLFSSQYLTLSDIQNNLAMVSAGMDLGPGYGLSALFFGLRLPIDSMVAGSMGAAGIAAALGSFKGIAGLAGMDLGMPFSVGAMIWNGKHIGTENFDPSV